MHSLCPQVKYLKSNSDTKQAYSIRSMLQLNLRVKFIVVNTICGPMGIYSSNRLLKICHEYSRYNIDLEYGSKMLPICSPLTNA